jgi:hypothetical protein
LRYKLQPFVAVTGATNWSTLIDAAVRARKRMEVVQAVRKLRRGRDSGARTSRSLAFRPLDRGRSPGTRTSTPRLEVHGMHRFSRRPSPAMAVAFIALVAALSGTAAALPGRNTVDSGDIKRGAVKRSDIGRNAVNGGKVQNGSLSGADARNDSLTGADINESTLGQVPSANQANSANTANTANTATTATNANHATTADTAGPIAFARVAADGSVDEAQSKNVTDANVTNPSAGRYCFNGLSFTPKGAQVTAEFVVNGVASTTTEPFDHFACAGAEDAEVTMTAAGGALDNRAFFILFY